MNYSNALASLDSVFYLPKQPPALREAAPRQGKPVPPLGHGLAGTDLGLLWKAAHFREHGRAYARDFMERMHHPFHEVLACLYLNDEHDAIAYNRYFRGEKASALAHLPNIARTARQIAATRVVLAYNLRFDPESTLPDIRRVYGCMAEDGVEVFDFLLVNPGDTRSLLASALA